jgi:presenilin-like A22 family membrane protease
VEPLSVTDERWRAGRLWLLKGTFRLSTPWRGRFGCRRLGGDVPAVETLKRLTDDHHHMDDRSRAVLASAGIVLVFVVVQLGALAVVDPLDAGGNQFVEDTSDPTISLLYVVAILAMTGLMLAAFRLGVDALLRGFVVFAGAYISLFVFRAVLPPVVTVDVAGTSVAVLAWVGAIVIGVALWVYPEWYVIDAAGIVMGIGAAGLFGINFGILPALVLLAVLAVYDAISVYGTEHMLTLASGVMEMRVPIVLVVPLTLSYSFLDADVPDPAEEGDQQHADDDHADDQQHADDDYADDQVAGGSPGVAATANGGTDPDGGSDGFELEREALFIGLGDVVIPTVLVASAAFFVGDVPTLGPGALTVGLPVAGAMAGTLVGLVVLLYLVLQGRAHAGLPLLNGGAIGGYLVGALAGGLTLLEALGLAGFL